MSLDYEDYLEEQLDDTKQELREFKDKVQDLLHAIDLNTEYLNEQDVYVNLQYISEEIEMLKEDLK